MSEQNGVNNINAKMTREEDKDPAEQLLVETPDGWMVSTGAGYGYGPYKEKWMALALARDLYYGT